ncbi:hypothetical protein M885DRAFT_516651 [Pelagophyceae sp. CCMP2097]|nr:hypothetical protein M885DRAFT_516651 [Pelagophyceae sp. CCMP2097]
MLRAVPPSRRTRGDVGTAESLERGVLGEGGHGERHRRRRALAQRQRAGVEPCGRGFLCDGAARAGEREFERVGRARGARGFGEPEDGPGAVERRWHVRGKARRALRPRRGRDARRAADGRLPGRGRRRRRPLLRRRGHGAAEPRRGRRQRPRRRQQPQRPPPRPRGPCGGGEAGRDSVSPS